MRLNVVEIFTHKLHFGGLFCAIVGFFCKFCVGNYDYSIAGMANH